MTRWGMAIDLRKCVGCQTCTIACKQSHNLPPGVFWRKVADCETGTYPDVQRTFLPMACMHCVAPPCMHVCPTTATRQRDDGIVTINYDICVGCGYCVVACPYDARTIIEAEVPYFAAGPTPAEVMLAEPERTGVCTKCDMCADRVDAGLLPVCVASCIGGAMLFGDLEDAESPVSRLLREQPSAVLMEELGIGPSVAYVGAPVGWPLIRPRQQRVWGWQAAANFSLGGMGAGLYLLGWLLGAPGAVWQLVAPALVALGLLAVATETGRPLRGLNLFRHLGSSWMSREALAAALFLALAPAGWVWPGAGAAMRVGAAAAAAAFVLSQGFMLYRSRGVTAWNVPLMPLLVAASGLSAGAGLLLMLTGGGEGVLIAVLFGAVNLGIWLLYLARRDGEFQAAVGELRRWPGLGLIVVACHLLPILLLLAAPRVPWAAGLAGLALAAGGALQKAGLVVKAGNLRAIRF